MSTDLDSYLFLLGESATRGFRSAEINFVLGFLHLNHLKSTAV
ncbi:hypothetical protein B6N60_00016 [Richelia sinica FACHB-800]|uniref:Uncharacterized protein n=1 Tax=Richelia sinica FACHB-800 TaxID=1357546 RepID=A0A975T3F8_9NOST|nr:hypothetical protein B6N60_00013 [Richelia sinica FACHB-800]QXE21342.1 hypothetical protein B6N60_00016 [Richelia sinica FACHB-800]